MPSPTYTIEYFFQPTQIVWFIQSCGVTASSVRQGTIIQVIGVVQTTATTVTYDIIPENEKGMIRVDEDDIFATLNDAIIEYESRLT